MLLLQLVYWLRIIYLYQYFIAMGISLLVLAQCLAYIAGIH